MLFGNGAAKTDAKFLLFGAGGELVDADGIDPPGLDAGESQISDCGEEQNRCDTESLTGM